MGEILRFPIERRLPVSGLRTDECGAVYTAACLLIAQGQAKAVSVENDGQYVCVFDRHGDPYFIGRVDGVCYLFDHETIVVARSIRFEVVLADLQTTLTYETKTPAEVRRHP